MCGRGVKSGRFFRIIFLDTKRGNMLKAYSPALYLVLLVACVLVFGSLCADFFQCLDESRYGD